ncbi:hypothetical protein ACFLWC_01480 [Chloroflexota bacterium]
MDVGKTCEACGYVSHLGAVARHHLIPESVTEQAGMSESAKVSLCCNCHFELHAWYKIKIADMVYDTASKQFRPKSWDERVKEYDSAFRAFKKYKGEQGKIC